MKIQYKVGLAALALALLAVSIVSYRGGLDILRDGGAKEGIHLRFGIMLVHIACLVALAFFSFSRTFFKAFAAATLAYTLFLAFYTYSGVIDLILVAYLLCSAVLIFLLLTLRAPAPSPAS